MEMIKVASSHLKKVGYNPFYEVLRIQFQNGSMYDYEKVPDYVYKSLLAAASCGRYHALSIKNRYFCRQIW